MNLPQNLYYLISLINGNTGDTITKKIKRDNNPSDKIIPQIIDSNF